MNAVTITVLIWTRTGRAQKQLEVQTSMRAFSHQYYKLLPHTPSRSLTLSTLLCFVIPLIWSAKLLQDIFLCFILPVCQVQHALWHLRLLLCVSCPGKHPTDEKQSAVGYIWDKHWRRDVSICSDTLTSDDLSVCQSFISQKSIQSILQQPTLDCGQGWTQTKYTGACRRRREGSGRRKKESRKKQDCKLRRRKLTGDCNLKCVSVWWQRSQLLLLLKFIWQNDNWRLPMVTLFSQTKSCLYVYTCTPYNAWPHLLYCVWVSEIWCMCISGERLLRGLPHPVQPSFIQSSSISAMES